MKRIILVGLVLIMVLSLFSGCTADDKNPNSSAGAQNNPQTDKDLEIGKEYAKDAIDKNRDMSDEEKEKVKDAIDSLSVNWPADDLPDGMPAYPEGEMIIGVADGVVSISITGTSSETLSKYLDDLKSDGWDIEEAFNMKGSYMATKDSWEATIMLMDGTLIIGVQQED